MGQYHFMLVHGSCLGAWIWYKLAALLESAGHSITALDMTACGIDPHTLDSVRSVRDFYRPLMDHLASSPIHNKLIIVGHSFGGVGVSMAAEAFPHKISAAIFATAMLPSPTFPVADIFDEYDRRNPGDSLLDSKLSFDHGPENPPTSVIFGPDMCSVKMYHSCPPEDLKLASMLMRPSRVYTREMARDVEFTQQRFGSVARAYIVSVDDRAVTEDFQRLMMERTPVDEVEEIRGGDHMVMLSKPQELFDCLLRIADKLA